MKLTVVQPAYFPNISVLSQIAAADIVVWGDTFFYSKQSAINRTRIKTASGAQWLTVPVLKKGKAQQSIADVKIDQNHRWRHRHLKSLQVSYQNSPYYFYLAKEIADLIQADHKEINELLFQSTLFLCQKISLSLNFIKSQNLPVIKNRTERVLEWVKQCGCDSYLMRIEDKKFVDATFIEKQGCRLHFFDFNQSTYHQSFGGFLANLSGLDLLFNEGEMSREILVKSCSAN